MEFVAPTKDDQWIKMVEGESGNIRESHIYPKLKNWINEIFSETVLDLGYGQGICFDQINLNNREYYGVDISPTLIKRAIELYRNSSIEFV